MARRQPVTQLATHEVTNQPPALENYDLYDLDRPLVEAIERNSALWASDRLHTFGQVCGSEEMLENGRLANKFPPELKTHDRYGHRIDEVEYHPAYHAVMREGVAHAIHSIAWTAEGPGGHSVFTALDYLLFQVEAGATCPLSMTYAATPALRQQPDIAENWLPGIMSLSYDPRCLPMTEKSGLTIGMAMTEKQGGSDVRANSTTATPLDQPGPGALYELCGHKWFCSAPMCDAFLTLAYTEGGLSCFLAPRWRPDGTRNAIHIQRLKDKLGNKSNASSEIEYHGAWAWMIGEDGHGIGTIINMVHHTRLSTTLAAAALIRQSFVQATHHARHRRAFQRVLTDQPVMSNVLADLALESEAATVLTMRVAQAFDASAENPAEQAFARIAVAVSKYWLNKRVGPTVCEAMECLGGAGYVEDSIMPRLYRESPLNGIWEGSGNVISLDVLRALQREPESLSALLDEIRRGSGGHAGLDRLIARLEALLAKPGELEANARRLVETMALCLQGSLVVRFCPQAVADAYCASRLDGDWGHCFGTLPAGVDHRAIVDRNWPA